MEWIIGIIAVYALYHLFLGYLVQQVRTANRREGIE